MDEMFLNCKSLSSINLSNFDASNIILMHNIFKGCLKLKSINLQNFVETNETEKIIDIFKDIPEKIL